MWRANYRRGRRPLLSEMFLAHKAKETKQNKTDRPKLSERSE